LYFVFLLKNETAEVGHLNVKTNLLRVHRLLMSNCSSGEQSNCLQLSANKLPVSDCWNKTNAWLINILEPWRNRWEQSDWDFFVKESVNGVRLAKACN